MSTLSAFQERDWSILRGKFWWGTVFSCLLSIVGMEAARCQVFAQEQTGITLERYEFVRIRMGVPWQILLYASSEQKAMDAAEAAFARVKKLDQMLSDYDSDSELNNLCKTSHPGKPVQVSEELFTVLNFSKKLAESSQGKFDVTVGGLTALWRIALRKRAMPSAEDIQAELKKVGSSKIKLNEKQRTVELMIPNMQLDLGGIAKGYAADEAFIVLKKLGITRVLIDASGDIVAGDPPPGKTKWIIGIAPLKNPKAEPTEYLAIANAAVATSGDANRFVELEGVHYSHIVDPHTGIGLTTSSSVTVIAKNGITSDALASALSVVNNCTRDKLLKKYQAESFIAIGTPQGIKTWESCRFKTYREKK